MRQVPPAYTPVPPAALLALAGSSTGAGQALHDLLVERHGAPSLALVGSGTQALTLGISALAGPGGAVALPGWGCYDLASAAVGAGVRVHLYDLDPGTLQPDPASLARALEGAAVAVVVSFFGIPVEPHRLPTGADVAWIHDAAQAHGAVFGPGSVEERADATVLSFGRGKGWTGLGGGALLLRTERARGAVEAGGRGEGMGSSGGRVGMGVRGAAQWLLGRPSVYGIPARVPALGLGETRYHPPHPVEAMVEASAAVLLASREAADREARVRRERARHLRSVLEGLAPGGAVEAVGVVPGADPGYLRFPVLDRAGVDREGARILGVLPSYPRPLATLEPLKPLLRDADPLPGSVRLSERLLTLPTHSQTSARDRARLESWLAAAPAPLRP